MKSDDISLAIKHLHIKDIKNTEHSSYYFSTSEYKLLITRFFSIEGDGLVGISSPYLIQKNGVYSYNREEEKLELMADSHKSIYDSVNFHLSNSEKLVMKYIEEIDKLEDELYMRKLSPIFLDIWFDLKKDITRIERMLERVYEALKDYIGDNKKSDFFPQDGFEDIMEHIQRYQRLAALNSNKLDTLYNYYNSLKSDKMNNNVYALTILSGIFLPLNLIVGFFGMNTENLFFSGNSAGTMNVVLILISLFIIFIATIPVIGIIEKFILRRLLGRFNIYNNLVSNIKKISIFTNK
ncbi:CorA family divalent cation transporter [bacterium]|nr:CorA family divalent cation transporter [bacterium]MBU1991088.1 CorA family divalent cation transporter [bacterium]